MKGDEWRKALVTLNISGEEGEGVFWISRWWKVSTPLSPFSCLN